MNTALFRSLTVRRFVAVAVALAVSLSVARAHDPTELTSKAYLRTNSLEVRVTLAASTVMLLLKADGHEVSGLSNDADLESVRTFLNTCAAGLFQISAGGKVLVATETNVTLSVED